MSKKKKKYIPYGISYARTQFHNLVHGLKNRKRAYYNIKEGLEFPELCEATDFIDNILKSNLKDLLFGNPLPKSYKEIGHSEYPYLSKNFISEINWTLISLRKHTYEINLFLEYKKDYEKNLLIGRYSEAEKYLTKIENEICFSLWSLENRFILKELVETPAENKEFLSQFNEENISKGLTKSLAHFLSLRAEKSLSVSRYIIDLENSLNKIETNKKQEHIDYYLFKLSFVNHITFSNFVEIIAFDFPHSIIDRYLNLRKVFSILLTTVNSKIDEFEYGKSLKDYLINRINYLIKKIEDPILYKLKLFAGDKIFPAFYDNEGKLMISIIDKYTSGLYQEMEEELKEALEKYPMQFDLYILYVKSLVFQKKSFIPLENKKSIQNQILHEIHKIISISCNPIEANSTLLRLANNLSSSVLSYGIVDFVFFQTNGKEERKLLSRLSYSQANPIVFEVFSENENQIEYLEMLRQRFPNSLTVDFFYNKLTNIENLKEFEKKIPEAKFKTEYARSLQNKGDYKGASEIWEYLAEKYNLTIPILETAIKNLFICYEELNRFDDCIKLYVDYFFENNYIVDKIEVKSILQKIKENRFRVVEFNIELPIFYTITNADENETHITFERFNLKNDVYKPSELIKNINNFKEEKIIFYLKYTSNSEILKHSTFISGSKERLEERLKICQFLREKDIVDKIFYDDEIKNITNILVMQKGLLQLDESKIYVNEQGIITTELKEFEAVFLRFKAISKIAEKSDLWMLNKNGTLTTLNYSQEKTDTNEPEYSSNPVYDVYKELFDAIREKFLHSKFGIVQYLSTRIRHGVLLGEIRPIFEKHHLITLKEGNTENYRRNYYWDKIYTQEQEITLSKMQTFLRDFSASIDGLIFDLIKEHLQVYDAEVKKNGWFDYEFDDKQLFWFSIRALHSRDFAHFAQQVFEILWERTDKNLEKIRKRIQNEIAKKFNELFIQLEKDIEDLLGLEKSLNIVSAIKSCSTDTQAVITRISSWFKRSGTAASDFDLSYVINIVEDHANKTHSNKRVELSKNIVYNCKIRGEFLTHFADLLRIFIENILKHADDKSFIVKANILTDNCEKDILKIELNNEITNQKSINALKEVWTVGKMDISKLSSEGKSGYHKAVKILRSDLKCANNQFYTKVDDEKNQFIVSMLINTKELLV